MKLISIPVAVCALLVLAPVMGDAREVRSAARTSVHQNRPPPPPPPGHPIPPRNVNVNHHVDIDVDVDDHYHPWATAAAVTTAAVVTGAVIGSMVRSVPPNCNTVVVNGISYSQCGNTWYQPQMQGSSVTYVVVNPPR